MAPMSIMILMKRVTEEELGDSKEVLLNTWIYFNLIGNNILLPIVVITFLFSSNAKRHPTLVNLCITWIFSGIFSLLLFYSKQQTGPEPDLSLCVAQASLLYGITPMWSVAVLALVHYMLHTLRGHQLSTSNPFPMAVILSSPYVAQCSFTMAALILSIQNPSKVNRHHRFLFCSLRHAPLFLAMTIFTLLVCLIIMVLEVALVVVIYRNWRTRRSAGLPSQLPTTLVARVLVFGLYIGLGVAVNIVSVFGSSLSADIFAATAGTVVFLIFGTQADVFRAWCFWKKHEDNASIPPLIPQKTFANEPPYPASLEAIFRSSRSSKSEKKFPWSDRPSRPPSIPSTHRSSTRQFMRLPEDEVEELFHNFPGQDPRTRQAAEGQRVNFQNEHGAAQDARNFPKRAKSEERRTSQGKITATGEAKKPEDVRKRRKWDLPRPKGPRKAGMAMNTIPAADSFITRPTAATFRPLPFISASADSSRTLGAGSASTSSLS